MFTKTPLNLVGERNGKLLILKKETFEGVSYWWCKCDCGNKKFILTSNILNTKSCGCLRGGKKTTGQKKHGLSKTKFYHTWSAINQRCYNSKIKNFKHYGGRGINVEWKTFEEFKRDMFDSFLEHNKKFGNYQTTIERKNYDGNYCKENCKWATQKEQANNRRSNRHFKKISNFCIKPRFISLAINVPLSFEEKILSLISKLPLRKAQILNLRYKEFGTLDEIGNKLGITRERVRQIESKALDEIFSLTVNNLV